MALTRPSGSSEPSSTSQKRQPAPAMRYSDRDRRWLIVPLALATFLVFSSLFGGLWWQVSLRTFSPSTGQTFQSVAVSYHIGGRVTCADENWLFPPTPCSNVTLSRLGGQQGVLYASLGYGLAVLGALGLAAIGLLTLASVGFRRHRRQLTIEIILVMAIAVGALAIPIATVVAGPGPAAAPVCDYLSENGTNCPFFWGSASAFPIPGECTGCGNSFSWGPTASFYQCLIAGILFAASSAILWLGRDRPFTLEEEVVWAARFRERSVPATPATPSGLRPVSVGPASAEPPPAPAPPPEARSTDLRRAYGRYEVPRDPWACPRCGSKNLQWANLCRNCGADRPLPPE
jgi:hypothetical protein